MYVKQLGGNTRLDKNQRLGCLVQSAGTIEIQKQERSHKEINQRADTLKEIARSRASCLRCQQ